MPSPFSALIRIPFDATAEILAYDVSRVLPEGDDPL
jgi:hypothetical protein